MLDVGLADMTGLQVVQHLRETNPGVCVLFLTARDSVKDRVAVVIAGGGDAGGGGVANDQGGQLALAAYPWRADRHVRRPCLWTVVARMVCHENEGCL